MSRMFSKTLREAPSSAETKGYGMLLRAGFIKQLANGIFDILPLGLLSIRKIENILREEMNALGGQEVELPLVNPADIWRKSGRFNSIGSEMTRLKDRNKRDLVLAMTHEEAVSDLALYEIDSYKKLPSLIYQIQTKWRDDPRPRAGLIRVREFTMKDSYSFDKDYESLEKQYKAHYDSYLKIFRRMKLPAIAIKSDSGMMGGKISHEFMYISPIGEDTIIRCKKCSYIANKQVARFMCDVYSKEKEKPIKEVHTPETKTIEALCSLLKIDKKKTAKMVFFTGIYKTAEDKIIEKLIAAVIRGDLDVEENKLQKAAKADDIRVASEEEIRKHGMEPGFASLVNVNDDCVVKLVDLSIVNEKNLVCGANKKDYHIQNCNYKRDFDGEICDIAGAKSGFKCIECGSELEAVRGVEIGNIFQLGTRYSEKFGLYFQDENGNKKPVVMGSYGIGVGRALGCLAEEYCDDKGLCLPISVSPYDVSLVNLVKNTKYADEIYDELQKNNVSVLYDDRDENAGVKFNDAELIGNPIIITVGNKSIKDMSVEVQQRANLGTKENIKISSLCSYVKELKEKLMKY